MPHALILGAMSDIAKALAHQYAAEGYHLTLAARNTERLNPLLSDLKIRYNIEAKSIEFDAMDYSSHLKFYDQLTPKPDVVFCVFGYLTGGELDQTDVLETENTIHTNYTGAVSILNIIARDFEQKKAGTIIGISSVAGDRGRQSNYIYGSAKAGFTAYLSGLRNRLFSSGVHVLTVKPGFTQTQMTEGMDLPKMLTAKPQEVAMDIYKAHQKGKDVIYTKWFWRWIMLIIISIPERIFKRMNL